MLRRVVLRVLYCGVFVEAIFFTVPLNLNLYVSTLLNLGQEFPRIKFPHDFLKTFFVNLPRKLPTREQMLQQTPFYCFWKVAFTIFTRH